MKSLEYVLLHMLANCPFARNALAVFPTSNDLSTSDRQSIAREFNLSECAFASASETASNHWGLRIFTHRTSVIRGSPIGEFAADGGECEMREYHGGCHCGAIGIIYRTNIDPMYWRLRHDGCSFCRRHGVVGTSDPAGNLSVDIEDPSKVRHYRFAHRTADFLICGECGVFVAAVTDTAQGKRAVINARVLNGVSLDWGSVVDVNFDDESPLQRADRRSLHWTPVLR
jgi:hypothetical protein